MLTMSKINEIREVKEAALFGRGLHLSVQEAEKALPIIADFLIGSKLSYTRLEQIKPSLEDVFVSIIEARDNRTNGQGVTK